MAKRPAGILGPDQEDPMQLRSTVKHTAAYWRRRARKARALAADPAVPETRRQTQIARSCDVLAEILERQSNLSDRCRAAAVAGGAES